MTITHIFVLKRKFADAGGHKQCFREAQAPQITPVASGLLLYFGAQSLLGQHNSRLGGGTSSDMGDIAQKCPPMAPGLHFTSLQAP